jgi:hypothetical protein
VTGWTFRIHDAVRLDPGGAQRDHTGHHGGCLHGQGATGHALHGTFADRGVCRWQSIHKPQPSAEDRLQAIQEAHVLSSKHRGE